MMGERDLEAEVKEKDEIIMSLRLNEHLLKGKLEVSRRNMSKQLERITALEKENEQLLKENVFLAKQRTYWKGKCAEWMGVKEENLSLRCVKMSEKRFKTKYYLKSRQGVVLGVVKVNEEDNVLHWNDVVDLLNEQEQKIQRWKNLYELKDAEVTARVDALNRVCNYYLTETRFKGDTDPNEAVKEVINEILNAPIYEE